MGSVFYRADRRAWWIKFRDPSGRWVSKPGAATRAEAQRLLVAVEARLDNALPIPRPPGPTVADLAARWLDRKRQIRDFRHYETALLRHVVPALGPRAVSSVTPSDIRDILANARQHAPGGPGRRGAPTDARPSQKTLRNLYGVIRTFFADLEADEVISRTPCRLRRHEVPKAQTKDPSFRTRAVFTRPEVIRLLTATAVPEFWRMLWAVLFLTGARRGEALELRWRDLDPEAEPLARLTISRSEDGPTKTGRDRDVPVHPELARRLNEWRRSGFLRHVGRLPTADDPIVPAANGNRLHPSVVWRAWKAQLADLGLRHRRIHDTRRTFISLALADGARKDVLRRVTHTGNADVFDTYTTLPWRALCEAVSELRIESHPEAEVVPIRQSATGGRGYRTARGTGFGTAGGTGESNYPNFLAERGGFEPPVQL